MSLGGLFGAQTAQQGAAQGNSMGLSDLTQGLSASGLGSYASGGGGIFGSLINGLTGNSQLSQNVGLDRASSTVNPYNSNTIGAGYTQSPGFQYQLGQAETGVANSAAARGGLLSGQNQLDTAATASNLANQDYWQYVQNQQTGIGTNFNNQMQSLGGMTTLGGIGESAGASIQGGYAGLASGAPGASASSYNAAAQQESSGINGLIGGIGGLFGL